MKKNKLNVFISYAHEDEAMKNDLDKHLIMLKRSDKIEVWTDKAVLAGDEWDVNIQEAMQKADIILLLVSVDFNNSKYIWEKELKFALENHEKGLVRVIPILLRSCEWRDMPYAKLQAIPAGNKPIKSFADHDEAYTSVAKSIRDVVTIMTN